MAANPYIIINGIKAYDVQFDGNVVFNAYMNGVHTYTKTLFLILPQHLAPIALRAWIDSQNPQGFTQIVVTNNLTQPRLVTGNMAGINVELINNGEFQGEAPGANGMDITSAIKITNNGWIRGAGGNGGLGGSGGNGGNLSETVTKTMIPQNSSASTTPTGCSGFGWNTSLQEDPPGSGTQHVGFLWMGIFVDYYGIGAASWTATANPGGGIPNGTYTRGTRRFGPTGVMENIWYDMRGPINERWTGGPGGNGGIGGEGQHFQTPQTNGGGGFVGSTGTDPNCWQIDTSYSTSSWRPSSEFRGGTGGLGGNGGIWGTDGTSGVKGSGGFSKNSNLNNGINGAGGSVRGNSISGWANAVAGSTQGNISGVAV